jgi:hypothetical protein
MANSRNYYLKVANGTVEIWQGKFAPKGQKQLIVLPGVKVPKKIKPLYTGKEVLPLAYGHYTAQADALAARPGTPDFEGIKALLDQAAAFAATKALKDDVTARRARIDVMLLGYKAEVMAARKTPEALQQAADLLSQAAYIAVTAEQKEALKADSAALLQEKAKLEAQVRAAAKKKAAAKPKSSPKTDAAKPAAGKVDQSG